MPSFTPPCEAGPKHRFTRRAERKRRDTTTPPAVQPFGSTGKDHQCGGGQQRYHGVYLRKYENNVQKTSKANNAMQNGPNASIDSAPTFSSFACCISSMR